MEPVADDSSVKTGPDPESPYNYQKLTRDLKKHFPCLNGLSKKSPPLEPLKPLLDAQTA
jgi:hypothetical protein